MRRAVILLGWWGCEAPGSPVGPLEPWAPDPDAVARHGALVADGDGVWVADTDRRAVGRYTTASGWTETDLGGEPTRLAVLGDAVLVTLRALGEVRLYVDGVDGPRLAWSAVLGGEPFDVLPDATLGRLWVTLGTSHEVAELDLLDGAVLRRWSVPGGPRGVVAVPGEAGPEALWVTLAGAPRVDRIDLETGEVASHPFPERLRFTGPECDPRLLRRRTSGDAALGEDGRSLWVATLWFDTWLDGPYPGATYEEEDDVRGYCSEPGAYEDAWRRDEPAITGRFNPVLVHVDPEDPAEDELVQVGWTLPARGDVFGGTVRSYPTGLTLLDDGGRPTAMVTLEASDALLSVDLDAPRPEEADGRFVRYGMRGVRTLGGPVAVAASDGAVWVWSWLDRVLERWPVDGPGGVAEGAVAEEIPALPSPLSSAIVRGRRHFYTAVKHELTFPGSGGSCSTCHAESRADGFMWKVSHPPYDTTPLSLAGDVGSAPPLLWTGEAMDVRDEVLRVTSQFLLASAMDEELALDIQAYVDSTPDIAPPPIPDAATQAKVDRGRELFESEAVGCTECHSGPRGKNGQQYEIHGWGPTNVPTLKGLSATAPYLHDASAPTLRDVLQLAVEGKMGHAEDLSEADLQAMVEFLLRF